MKNGSKNVFSESGWSPDRINASIFTKDCNDKFLLQKFRLQFFLSTISVIAITIFDLCLYPAHICSCDWRRQNTFNGSFYRLFIHTAYGSIDKETGMSWSIRCIKNR